MPIFEAFWVIGSLISVGIGIRLRMIYQKRKEEYLYYFSNFFIFGGIGFGSMSLVGPVISAPFFMKIGTVISFFILFISAAFLTRLCFFLLYPKLSKTAFWSVICFNALLLIFQVNDFLLPEGAPFSYDSRLGITTTIFPSRSAILIIIISFASLFLPGLIFIFKGWKSRDRKIKTRAILLGLGMFFFGTGGIAYVLNNPLFILISVASLSSAFLTILGGAFYSIKK